jgi:hypothetical protein
MFLLLLGRDFLFLFSEETLFDRLPNKSCLTPWSKLVFQGQENTNKKIILFSCPRYMDAAGRDQAGSIFSETFSSDTFYLINICAL